MTPAARALCDRLIYDIACLEHAVDCLDDADLAAEVPGVGAPVAPLLAWLADRHEAANEALGDVADGAPPPDPWVETAPVGPGAAIDDIGDLLGALADLRDESLELLESTGEDFVPSSGLDEWSRDYFANGLRVVAAFPALHTDPLLLAWTLRIRPANDEAANLQQSIRVSAKRQLQEAQEAAPEA